MRSSRVFQEGPKCNDKCPPYQRQKRRRHREERREPCEDEGRDWSSIAKEDLEQQKREEERKDPPLEASGFMALLTP